MVIENMSLKDIAVKHCYDSDEDNILADFYIPVLRQSYRYFRLAGFFRSSALAVAARGIQGLLQNDGEMKLIASAVLSKKDVGAIKEGLEFPEKSIERMMIDDLNQLEEGFIKDHVCALGWMIAKKKLEIKIAVVTDDSGFPLADEYGVQLGIFHQKIAIFEDKEGNKISFSGSVNESATAWGANIEDFNVFRDWVETEKEYLGANVRRFEKYWNGKTWRTKIIDIPVAVKEKLIKMAPERYGDLDLGKWKYKQGTNNHDGELILEGGQKYIPKKIVLRNYQNEAIQNWIRNDKKGIFEMATGTGKTFTALGCIKEIIENYNRAVIIISCPYQHLIQQWKGEIEKFGIVTNILIADSSNTSWKNELTDMLVDISLGYKDKIFVLTTHSTFSSNNFISILGKNKDLNILVVGDEVHGLGAEKSREGLKEQYTMRLGLSATPKRWYDEIGTGEIYSYFGGVVFEFDLWKAINSINQDTGRTFLTPYRYIPKFVTLNDEELFEYELKSKSIVRLLRKAKDDIEKEEMLQRLLFQRANIIKNAEKKYQMLEKILGELGKDIKHTIIYCSPQQIDAIMEILNSRRIISHRFTMDEGTRSEKRYKGLSEREFILKNFAEGKYSILVAMKCLDEGVDVPPARRAILMASSGNPREYIQRIGRVIRRHPGKKEATIYDVIVSPSLRTGIKELKEIERKVFQKEIIRYEEIAKNALNNADALRMIYNIKNSVGVK